MSLRTKFLKNILPPLLLGAICAILISSILIFMHTPYILTTTKNTITENEYKSLLLLSNSLGSTIKSFFISSISNMQMISRFAKELNDGRMEKIKTDGYLSIISLLKGEINPESVPGIDKSYYTSTEISAWYAGPSISDLSGLSKTNKENLRFASQVDIIIRPIFTSDAKIQSFYLIFDNDGFIYRYPMLKDEFFLTFKDLEQDCKYFPSGKMEAYDARCRPFYQESNLFLDEKNHLSVIITNPYWFSNKDMMGITICDVNKEKGKINYLICGDFELTLFDQMLSNVLIDRDGSYFIISPYRNGVMYHPNIVNFDKSSMNKTLTELEFGISDSLQDPNAVFFNRTVLPYINQTFNASQEIYSPLSNTPISYIRMGYRVLIEVFPLFIGDEEHEMRHYANLVTVIRVTQIEQTFEQMEESINRVALIQSLALIITSVITIILYVKMIDLLVNSIISPINELKNVVLKMVKDDLDADVDENFSPNSEDIAELYQTFTKLKFVMKYANAEFFGGNDAQALINYSMALKLYKDINNIEGIGMTYNNIGNIHLRNERFEEAIQNYREAVAVVENQLNLIYKTNHFRQTFTLKDENQTEVKAYMNRSRRRIDFERKKDNPKKTTDLTKLEDLYANRLYQLSNALMAYLNVLGEEIPERWVEILDILSKVIKIDSNSGHNTARIINNLIHISNGYLQLGNHIASLKYLNEAENTVKLYEQLEKVCSIVGAEEIVDTFSDSSLEASKEFSYLLEKKGQLIQDRADILRQRVLYQYGFFFKTLGKYQQACKVFTKCLETGKIYDPGIRKKCLDELSLIMAQQNLLTRAPNVTRVLNRMENLERKNIMFLLDYSESMAEGARIQYALRNILKIFDKYMKGQDTIGFIRFNTRCEVVFGLTEKMRNTIQMRVQIERNDEPCGGTAFYDAIKVALREFKKIKSSENTNWIVALTDGEDNCSKTGYQAVQKRLISSNINLIIIGLGIDRRLCEILSGLTKATPDGVFIENPNTPDLDITFQAITEIIFEQSLIVETFRD